MKKIPSLFKRNYSGNRQVYDEIVPGCEWVINGEGIATIKYDGTACMIQDGRLYKRYDRKRKRGKFKPAPAGWMACEDTPNEHTGHWPGWVPVGNGPEDKYHREAFNTCMLDGTYELVGPKVQSNPYGLEDHCLWRHGEVLHNVPPRTFDDLRAYLAQYKIEGIVWHHPDGRMCKIKRRDLGLPWPIKEGQ